MAENDKTQNLIKVSIKKIIREKGLTLAEVAAKMPVKGPPARIGMSGPALSQMLNSNPTIDTLERIAKVLQCDLRSFFELAENDIYGLIQYKGQTFRIESVESLKRLLADVENA